MDDMVKFFKKRKYYVNVDSRKLKSLGGRNLFGKEPVELIRSAIPLDGIKGFFLQVILTGQPDIQTLAHIPWQYNLDVLQR